MALRVYFSNQIEKLSQQFAAELKKQAREDNLFTPIRVIVPNSNLKQWLRYELATHNQIAANLEFEYLENGFWNLLTSLLPAEKTYQLIDQSFLEARILLVLMESDQEELAVLSGNFGGPRKPRDRSRRLWQLATRLAALFREYEYHRQSMLQRWLQEQETNGSEVEKAQACLYRKIFSKDGMGEPEDKAEPITLPQLFQEWRNKLSLPAETPSDPIHLFGLSQISRFHSDLIHSLGQYFNLVMYQLNFTPALYRQDPPNLNIEEEDTGLLKLWGFPGREILRLMNDSQNEHVSYSILPTGEMKTDTLLETVQEAILKPGSSQKQGCKQDRSLQIVGCSSPIREVEMVRNSIITNMQQDPKLKLTDIAVLVIDLETYKPALLSCFTQRDPYIPFNLSDSSAYHDSLYGQAVLSLLDLAYLPNSRKEVFESLLNPCVLAGLRVLRGDVLRWAEWASRLGIYSGYDKEHHKEFAREQVGQEGQYGDTFTWKQGLQRLHLGQIMQTSEEAAESYQGLVPYRDMETSESRQVSRFSMVIEKLHRKLNIMKTMKAPLSAWLTELESFCEEFLGIPSEYPEEALVRYQLFQSLQQLIAHGFEKEVDLAFVRELFQNHLSALPSKRGRFLTDGVTISSMRPLRPIPFKVVYVLGLQEGNFPGQESHSMLDLRLGSHQLGEISIPEANRYLFLETILSARKKLYLSYTNRDLQKDQTYQPCSTLNELLCFLNQLLPPEQKFQMVDLPMYGNSPRYLRATDEQQQFTDVLENYSIEDRIRCLQVHLEGLPPEQRGQIQTVIREKFCQVSQSEGGGERSEYPPIRFNILEKFLENPIEAGLHYHFGITTDEGNNEQEIQKEVEPYYTESLARWKILKDTLDQGIKEKLDTESMGGVMDGLYETACRLGKFPQGAFASQDKKDLGEALEEVLSTKPKRKNIESLSEFLASMGAPTYQRIVVGENQKNLPVDKHYDPLVLDLEENQRIPIYAEIEYYWKPQGGQPAQILVLAPISKSEKDNVKKKLIKPYLFFLIASSHPNACELIDLNGLNITIAFKNGLRSHHFKSISQEDAQSKLKEIVSGLLRDAPFDLLPLECLSDLIDELDKDSPTFLEALQNAVDEKVKNKNEYSYWPPQLIRMIEAQVPTDALEKVKARLGWLQEVETQK